MKRFRPVILVTIGWCALYFCFLQGQAAAAFWIHKKRRGSLFSNKKHDDPPASSPSIAHARQARLPAQHFQRPSAGHMHATCTAHARHKHGTCTAHARDMHGTCTGHARHVHAVRKPATVHAVRRTRARPSRSRRSSTAHCARCSRASSSSWTAASVPRSRESPRLPMHVHVHVHVRMYDACTCDMRLV